MYVFSMWHAMYLLFFGVPEKCHLEMSTILTSNYFASYSFYATALFHETPTLGSNEKL